jgi:hypothetical protein
VFTRKVFLDSWFAESCDAIVHAQSTSRYRAGPGADFLKKVCDAAWRG